MFNLRHCSLIFLLPLVATADPRIEDFPVRPDTTLVGEIGRPAEAGDFAGDLSSKVLIGSYIVDAKGGQASPLKTDGYQIAEVRKTGDETYVVTAKIGFGGNDVLIPVPVTVRYAGAVPVLTLENLAIPMMGEGFGCKLVFDFESGRYAGTWSHGDVGGSMWGRIEDAPAEPAAP